MAENMETPEKSLNEDEDLSLLTYKQLQQIAMNLRIPANLKHSTMIAIIKAQLSENTEEVNRIMSERPSRNRRRASGTSQTSPVQESLALSPPMSPPISPPDCPVQILALPLASSSPKITYQSASQSLPEKQKDLKQMKLAMTIPEDALASSSPKIIYQSASASSSPKIVYQSASQSLPEKKDLMQMKLAMTIPEDAKGVPMVEVPKDSECEKSLTNAVESETLNTSCSDSSDNSSDPLQLESPYYTDSAINSVGSDADPLVGVKDTLAFSEKNAVSKDLTDLKPVPPSELMDLSLPVPLLDSSLPLKTTLNPNSAQNSLLLTTSVTQALMSCTTVEENMLMNSSLGSLCSADLSMSGTDSPSTSTNMEIGTEIAQPKDPSNHTSDVNFPLRESAFIGQQVNLLKRPSQGIENIPTKQPKISTVTNIASSTLSVSPLAFVSPGASWEKSSTAITLPSVTTTCAAVTLTTSMTPVPAVQITASFSEEQFQPSLNSLLPLSTFPNQGFIEDTRASTGCTSVVSKPASSSSNCKTRSSIRYAVPYSSGFWLMQSKSNIKSNESRLYKGLPSGLKKTATKNSGTALKGNAGNKFSAIRKSSTVKPSNADVCRGIEICPIQFKPKITTPSQVSPIKRLASNQICCGAATTSKCSRQTQNTRSHSQPAASSASTTFVSAPSTVTSNGRKLDQPNLPASSGFAIPTVPTRTQPSAGPRPGRPESSLNFAPNSHQSNLPPFSNFSRDLPENPKPPNRLQELSHSFPCGDTFDVPLPSLVQPRVEARPSFLPPPPMLTKTPQMDFPAQAVQSAFVGQNLSVGPNLSSDSSPATLRQSLEAPVMNVLQNRDMGRRSLYNSYQYDTQPLNVLTRSQSLPPTDHYKDMFGGGQVGNYPLQMQNYPRMQHLPKPESVERTKMKEFFAEQRLGPSDLPKSLECIYNYQKDALKSSKSEATSDILGSSYVASGRVPTHTVSCASSYVAPGLVPTRTVSRDTAFVASGQVPTHTVSRTTSYVASGRVPPETVSCYEAAICLTKVKPSKKHVGTGSHQTEERHRASQEFVPYSSTNSLEQSAEMYSAPLNAALSQPCQPPWFPSDPCLPPLPVNQYWPQAVNPQPPLRLTQPYHPVYQRNLPNNYFPPLKPPHVPNPGAFLNQPHVDNMAYQSMPQLQDVQSYHPRDVQPYQHREAQPCQSRNYQPYQHRNVQQYQHRDVQSYQPPEPFDKVLPMQENPQLSGQDLMSAPNQTLNQCQNQIHQEVPDFQGRGDQLSLSMIYNYLTSTEQMPVHTPRQEFFENQSPSSQRPVYSRPIFPGTLAGTLAGQFASGNASQTATASPARPKRANAPAKSVSRQQEALENSTVTPEAAYASVSAVRKKSKVERQKCVNFENGCSLVLPLSQLAEHEECCEYINFRCPKETCDWNGRARKLATHVREAHRVEINTGTDCTHVLPDVRALERVCFLQEVSRKLFAICCHCHGGVLYVSIQYIASGRAERPTSATGCIEVVGQDGHPHSWRGKLLPYYQSVESLLSTASCLEVSLRTLGALAGSTITLHISIRVYSGNTNVAMQPRN